MKYDYYVAGRYRNKENVLDLTKRLREKGKSVYCFIESAASINHVGEIHEEAENAMKRFENIDDWWNDERVKDVFRTDLEAEKNSDTFVLLLPAGKSVHIEAGIAYGLGKNCILVGKQEAAESLYLIFHEHYDTPDEFLATVSTF